MRIASPLASRGLAFLLVFTLVAFAVPAGTLQAQSDDGLPKADLSDSDLKSLRSLFEKAMKKGNVAGIRKLREHLETYSKRNNVGSPLADYDAWVSLAKGHYADRIKKGKAKVQKGRIVTDFARFKSRGEAVTVKFAYRLPKGYTPKKAWPVVLCFHGMKSARAHGDGKSYLKKVYEANKETKSFADKVILIAPDVGEMTEKEKGVSARAFEWFDFVHLQAMVRPLRILQNRFHIDSERIFVEGNGRGADMALELAALYGARTFAGVIARQGVLSKDIVRPAVSQIPALLLHRTPHKKERDGETRVQAWKSFKTFAQAEKWKAETVEFPAPEKMNSNVSASQKIEPIWDQLEALDKFVAETRFNPYPAKFRIVTDNGYMREASFVRLTGEQIKERSEQDPKQAVEASFEIDREKNTIRVKSDGIYAMTFFLNDKVLDLSRKIEVYVNDVLAESVTQERSLRTLLNSIGRSPYEPLRFHSTVLQVEVPTKATEDEEAGTTETGDAGK